MVSVRSACVVTGVTTVTVLLGVGSGVVLVPTAVLVMLPVLAVTVALSTRVSVPPMAKLATVAVAPVALLLERLPPVTTGVPLRLRPALSKSVSVTFNAVLGPRLTRVTV